MGGLKGLIVGVQGTPDCGFVRVTSFFVGGMFLLLTVRAWSSAFFASVFVRFVWRGEPLFAEETLC